jgi:hypothetical protein
MTLNAKVKLGSLLAATAISAMALLFTVSSASALQNCKGAHNCGAPPVQKKCHTVNVTCPGGHHPTSCNPHTVTVCN